MTSKQCKYCGNPLNLLRKDAKFCSQKCGTYFRRKSPKFPRVLTSRPRWVRWRSVKRGDRMTKVPLMPSGKNASTTDESTWRAYSTANTSSAGDGLGFVLNGDGISCIDLDDVILDGELDPRAKKLLAEVEPFYVEVSPSGNGIHAWVREPSPLGHPVFVRGDGLKVEWYSSGRYMTMTGNVFQ